MNDEERILKEIKDVLKELDEQGRMKYTQKYMQHSDISVYKHCISVAYTSVELADRLAWNVNRRELIRGALLHDYMTGMKRMQDTDFMDLSMPAERCRMPGKILN